MKSLFDDQVSLADATFVVFCKLAGITTVHTPLFWKFQMTDIDLVADALDALDGRALHIDHSGPIRLLLKSLVFSRRPAERVYQNSSISQSDTIS